MLDINDFDLIRIALASPEMIRRWSNGEVKKPETINYRTLKPEKDGLFCEKIFGPTKDWECYCGKYKRVRFKGIICERCGVEVTRSKVRRDRMGHIELVAPVSHIWYFKGIPSRMGYLLDLRPRDLEKVLYFAAYIITDVNKDKIKQDLNMLEQELNQEIAQTQKELERELKDITKENERKVAVLQGEAKPAEGEEAAPQDPKKVKDAVKKLTKELKKQTKIVNEDAKHKMDWGRYLLNTLKDLDYKQLIGDEMLFRDLRTRYDEYFTGAMGAEAVRTLLSKVDLDAESVELREVIKKSTGQKRKRAVKRLKVVTAFKLSTNKPEWMILESVPVIPPDLRPMVQLDGGRFATSDLNDLYRRVINRNNRLKRLLDLGAPEIIVNNEKRMLQEAVDALFDNGRRGRPVTGPGNRPLKSLSDMLKGKQGRFRQNLLGKRVDYSGRSVIVIGPELKLHQCGLPKVMALELFKPFVMKRLVDLGHAQNIRSAKRMVERGKSVVWDVLEEVITDHPVLLNRAPTLHRLGIQAFEPVLVEGKAIQVHPLVCTAFNADFDGDQMAVHLPLSAEAQAESRILMLSTNNILSPAHGRPLTTPTQDMILGTYYLTADRQKESVGDGKFFTSSEEVIYAVENKDVDIHANIKVRIDDQIIDTTPGRVLFNEAMPEDYPFVNAEVGKKELARIVEDCVSRYPNTVSNILDKIKETGFVYATKTGITLSIDDITIPPNKWEILDGPEEEVDKIENQYRRGLITNDERHQRVVDVWTRATEDVSDAMEKNFGKFNSIYMMAHSGARGNIKQIRQLAGMRGLVANPKGDIIDRPIKANFREGLTVLEYFISTHGARKGLADTALRTADSGYLTRRLVDVAQDVIIREEDCGTKNGITASVVDDEGKVNRNIIGRYALKKILGPKGKGVLVEANQAIDADKAQLVADAGVLRIEARSVLSCQARHGVCQKCYGWSLADGKLIDIGTAVGIIAAQSIGEPGTQLTMRTFHTGGVAGEDITHGLPRVVELFEARKPKGQAEISEISGKVKIEEEEDLRNIIVYKSDKEKVYQVPRRVHLKVKNGEEINAGDMLTDGSLNPHDVLKINGPKEVELYMLKEVQEVYKSQGVEINDKHIEVIIRQMLKRVTVNDAGDTDLLPGQMVDRFVFQEENRKAITASGKAATAKQVLLGITKASLATDSFLSAASFQETTRVLTDAVIAGRTDPLLGLKENVIIGKLIPAATGMHRYRDIKVLPIVDGKPVSEEDFTALGLGASAEADEGQSLLDGGDPLDLTGDLLVEDSMPEETIELKDEALKAEEIVEEKPKKAKEAKKETKAKAAKPKKETKAKDTKATKTKKKATSKKAKS
ncbi:MAG: DNA-directed RNA polymerase subunit beta' [Actinobacteria bacterium]|nr:MAG: DNA-directed RNA polymerase subunit beta' [Actinomycetota bacterium]